MIFFGMAENYKNLALSEIMDIEKIKAVNKPIEEAHGLPNECYTNSEYLIIEREKVFKDKWTVIGVGSSVP
ncbi:aromatic ring-hydroxylating dioxygenase subunit alpha, partial [Pelagibacteraceae bacterium]|nr:aromatic ring-hydroxylating dioxygenase subunit alpha [Pelagibacteraceae bacterium]